MSLAYLIIGLVALQRFCEMLYAERNTRNLLARGAIEIGRKHYPLLIGLHGCWLIALLLALPDEPRINIVLLVLYVLLQFARLWVIASLGPYWTTRIVTVPGEPLIARGPYRFMRHPNYVVVTAEIAVLPLVFGEIWVAIIFSLLNAAVLALRIAVEDAALAPRR